MSIQHQNGSQGPRILDDAARMAGGAAGLASALRRQVRNDVKSRVEDIAARLNLVPREDLDRIEAMIQALRTENENLSARVEALEGKKDKAKTRK